VSGARGPAAPPARPAGSGVAEALTRAAADGTPARVGVPVIVQVVVGLPVPRVFSYAVPPELPAPLVAGQRVRVPFRGRNRIGVVVGLGGEDTPGLTPLIGVLDPVPALTPTLLALTRWAAAETVSSWGEAIVRALPPGVRSGAPTGLAPERPPEPRGPVFLATGSGRAETVVAEVAQALERDAAVLVLAPEIETARAWADRLGSRLGAPVSLATSRAPSRRRWQTWWAARQGEVRIVVGTRAAAFVPANPLGLQVVLDEEDPAHKAPDAPRWHARDLAIERAGRDGGTCLLAAAAPSLESWVRVESGRAQARPAGGGPWPQVRRVDLSGDPGCALSAGLRDEARAVLAGGRSVLLLLNRLGYGRVLACAECGAVRRCATCRVALTFHQAARALGCRLCGAIVPAPSVLAVEVAASARSAGVPSGWRPRRAKPSPT
jgi:primosomal protein N' (replication factor Y)